MRVSRVTLRGVAGLPDLQIEPADGLVALVAADRGLRLKLEEVLWNAILTGGRTRDAEGARIEVETVPALQDTALRTRSWVDLWRDMTVSTPEGVLLAAAELLGKVGAAARPSPPAARATRPGRRAALGNELRSSERELRALRADHAEASGDLEETTMEWLRERQDAETHLLAYRDRARELKGRLSHLEASGADAPCPTCGRVLEEHVAEVVRRLREEWETVVQDGSWWKRRREQLELKPSGIAIWRDGCCGCTQPWRPARKGSSSWGRRSADVLHRGLEWLRARAGGPRAAIYRAAGVERR